MNNNLGSLFTSICRKKIWWPFTGTISLCGSNDGSQWIIIQRITEIINYHIKPSGALCVPKQSTSIKNRYIYTGWGQFESVYNDMSNQGICRSFKVSIVVKVTHVLIYLLPAITTASLDILLLFYLQNQCLLSVTI